MTELMRRIVKMGIDSWVFEKIEFVEMKIELKKKNLGLKMLEIGLEEVVEEVNCS